MKDYDLIVIGTGSAMNLVNPIIQGNPGLKVAVIDKDEPGGICLTRGCIPSKLLLYPAELLRMIDKAEELGIDLVIQKINFKMVMDRMRTLINQDIQMIQEGLSQSTDLDYYPTTAEFTAPYTLKVDDDLITSKMIFLCTGSKPLIPSINGLNETSYLTSDTVLELTQLPESIVIIGGGYIAAEYGHFFSAMGSKVTIIGRNPQFLKQEEPEISLLAKRELQKYLTIYTNCDVHKVETTLDGKKKVNALNRENGNQMEILCDEILVATGRSPNTDLLLPEKGGVKTDQRGWIRVNEFLETSKPNIWAFGDANGKYLFKHAGNYESLVVYYNAILKKSIKVDYHAIPHAVFSFPEIAGVGLKQKEAVEAYGNEKVLIGFQRYQDTAKGEAMNVKDFFVKVIVERDSMKILGAHIIGPYASVLIQEIINLMYTPEQDAKPIINGMHIHPALSEVVERAFSSLMSPDQYYHVIGHHYNLSNMSKETTH